MLAKRSFADRNQMKGNRMMTTAPPTVCRICGSNDSKPFAVKNGFHLTQCHACQLVQVADDLSDVQLETYYDESFFDETYDWLKEQRGRKKEYDKFHFRMEEIERFTSEKGTILDIGCSYGFFLDVARNRGWEVAGIDVGESAIKFAKEELELEVYVSDIEGAPFPSRHFDAVTLWNVIEHVSDPLADFRRINRVLKVGGIAVFTTGDVGSLFARIMGEHWRMLIPPIHISNFHINSVKVMLERSGFELVFQTVALPREALLVKLRLLGFLRKVKLSDKMMVFARKIKDV